MYDYSKCMNRVIACIDLKSFYASCACVLRGLDPLKVKLAVVGDISRPGSIVLAATPELKKLIKPGSHLYDIPKRSDILVVNPTMEKYVQISNYITKIYMKYVATEDLHTYSCDESFLDLTQSFHLFGDDPVQVVKKIQKEVYQKTGIIAAACLSQNLFLAKVGLDNEAKYAADHFAYWNYSDVQTKLWSICPVSKMWSISSATEQHLNKLGITTVGELAAYPKESLIQKFGKVKGTELHLLSHGIDESRIAHKYTPKQTTISMGQILLSDCRSLSELKVLLLEQVEEACNRLRSAEKCCRTIELGIGYSKYVGGGFKRSHTVDEPICITEDVYNVCLQLLDKFHTGYPVRQIHIGLKNLTRDDAIQMSLFEDTFAKDRKRKLAKALDQIRYKHGKNSIMRAISFTDNATQRKRNGKIGGHSK